MKKRKFNSMRELNALAAKSPNRFANATGEALAVRQMNPAIIGPDYIGAGDPMLEISGDIQDFRQEGSVEKQIIISIKNDALVDRTVVLFPGYNLGNTVARPGQLTDGAFNDVTGAAGLTGSSGQSGVKLSEMLAYVKEIPTRVVGMRVQSTTSAQIQKTLRVDTLDIFTDRAGKVYYPSLGVNGNTFNDKISTIEVDFQLDALSDITYTIAPGETTITFFCGASLSLPGLLQNKARAAKQNLRGY